MVSLRISSLKNWLWRRDAVRQGQEGEKESDCKGKKSFRQETSGKGPQLSLGSSKELQRAASGASSSLSRESSLQEASDWLIGWEEPHGPGFCSEGSFAVLVPCYDSPPASQMSPQTPPSISKSQLWADVLTKVAMETETQAENNKKPSQ
ncbi:hypothetical protein GOP47_0011051 [Adiantum capillus-veneris]|uniref:Uncharacterized protein n=1 Tax=Adiantum capillus-veneris TaxID=13818 RepID=A0A9D4UTE7_ADICA|nr:hypothetical protein GOP47_0011051 [Adiantum capillus-veneris]